MFDTGESLALVIFGITGNLAQIKLIPALYDMSEKGLLPDKMSIIGNARKPRSQDEIENYITDVLNSENIHHKHDIKPEILSNLLKRVSYIDGNLDDGNFYNNLKKHLEKLGCSNIIFYLATYPELYAHVFEGLQKEGLNKQEGGFVRLMIEKPIGNDQESAKSLNQLLLEYFTEDQIFRLDHYLGKETLQNILAFRFANGIFEPLINSEHVDHIQITASEDFGIGNRGGYYDKVGALRDVGQNHQLQMLAFASMDAPNEFSNRAVTDERIKILKALKPIPAKIVFGQYEGYKREKNVDPNSNTDTFYAFKTEILNERFKDVPVYVRGGKMLAKTVTEISIVFKIPKNRLFKEKQKGMEPNVLVYRIQPNEGIVFKVFVKKPGVDVELDTEYMQYCYKVDPHFHNLPDPYERLISDAIRGDQTFFNDAEEVETQWAFVDPLIHAKRQVSIYPRGSWGPKEADKLIEADGRSWLEPSENFCRF